MDLSAYSIASIQVVESVVRQALEAGLALSDLLQLLAKFTDSATVPSPPVSPKGPQEPCPSEGCPGHLEPWPKSSAEAGVPIIGCILCRYSRIRGVA